ncbi:MAG: SDR family oxidoreductase [Desulfovibrio sp.]|nr:SDR family oxidoreductase [Desulfovibrio sp.]
MTFSADQVILVTGASSGIGEGIARACVDLGATVLAVGRNGERLETARAATSAPGRWTSLVKDLAEAPATLPEWITGLSRTHGKLWGLVHCAGRAVMDTLRTFDLAQSRDIFDINFNVPLLLTRAMADKRVHRKGGSVVFLASVSGVFPEKGHLVYGATKAALVAAAKSLSQEVAPLGLRVNCISPGIVDTPMQKAAEAFMGPHYRETQLAQYPLGFGQPEDVAEMAAFLLSTKARWITGQNFILSGGRY